MSTRLDLLTAHGERLGRIGAVGQEALELDHGVVTVAELEVVAAQGFWDRKGLERAAQAGEPGQSGLEVASALGRQAALEPVVGRAGFEGEERREELAAAERADHAFVRDRSWRERHREAVTVEGDGVAVAGRHVSTVDGREPGRSEAFGGAGARAEAREAEAERDEGEA